MDFSLSKYPARSPEMSTPNELKAARQIPEYVDVLNELVNISDYYQWMKFSNGYEEECEVDYYHNSYKFADISRCKGIDAVLSIVKAEMESLGIIGRTNIDQRVVLYDSRYHEKEWSGFYGVEENCVHIASKELTSKIETGETYELDAFKDINFIRTLAHELCHSLQDITVYEECNKLGYWMNPLETEAYDMSDRVEELFNEFMNGEKGKYDAMFTELSGIETITI